jgi:hypothetical protein
MNTAQWSMSAFSRMARVDEHDVGHGEVGRDPGAKLGPKLAWLALGAVAVFLISRLHERAVHAMDRYFNRELDAAETRLIAAIKSAKKMTEIDRLLTDDASDDPCSCL